MQAQATPSAYLDAAGKPLLKQSVTGFLDVLGFSNLSTTAGPEESQRILETRKSAV
jgi:hypothetical protein